MDAEVPDKVQPTVTVYTVGHSNHPIEKFLELLRSHRIDLLMDVRSSAASRYSPQFNGPVLAASLAAAGIGYRAIAALGGKPADKSLLQADGTPDYDRIGSSPAFVQALDGLVWDAGRRRVAIMCAEADPIECHRERLIAPILRRRGLDVRHILPNGRIAAPSAQGLLDL